MKSKLLGMLLLAGGSLFAQSRFSVNVGVGNARGGGFGASYYSAPARVQQVMPPCPGPDYSFIGGRWTRDFDHDRDDRRFVNNRRFDSHERRDFGHDRDDHRNFNNGFRGR